MSYNIKSGQRHSSPTRSGRAILSLVALNALLAVAAIWLWWRPQPERSASPDDVASNSLGSAPAVTSTGPKKSNSTLGNKTPESMFTWRQLGSQDLRRYIANLRGVNCPEETVQDIIIAEVDRIYRGKEAALRLRSDNSLPWENVAREESGKLGQRIQLRQLRLERQALLQDLLGIVVSVDLPPIVSVTLHDRFEEVLAQLPEERRGPVREIQEQFWQKTAQLKRRTDELLFSEDLEELRQLRRDRRDSLARLLTPQEIENLETASSSTAAGLRNWLPTGFEPNDSEFRAVAKIHQTYDDEFEFTGRVLGDTSELDRNRQAAVLTREQELKTVLGEQRYTEYQRAQDSTFRSMAEIAKGAGLPLETAIEGYQMINDTRGQIAQLRQRQQQDPNLSTEQRNAELRQVEASLQNRLRQTFGDEVFAKLQPQLPRLAPRGNPKKSP
ncbi:MAG: hypothetical protein EXS36_13300 [Pedosphaera sp.]|nr:hypothetical protein [Pedosphaera sp.]